MKRSKAASFNSLEGHDMLFDVCCFEGRCVVLRIGLGKSETMPGKV